MKRITFTMDERGLIQRICADEEVEVYIVCPGTPRDRVYRWGSLRVGRDRVDEEIDGWPSATPGTCRTGTSDGAATSIPSLQALRWPADSRIWGATPLPI